MRLFQRALLWFDRVVLGRTLDWVVDWMSDQLRHPLELVDYPEARGLKPMCAEHGPDCDSRPLSKAWLRLSRGRWWRAAERS